MNLIRFVHGCPGHRMHSNMNIIMVWAWQLNKMLIMLEVLGCTLGAVAVLNMSPLRAHLAAKFIADLLTRIGL